MDDNDLQLDFAGFCFDHFQHSDTTKDDQYETPLGSKDTTPNGKESESIEVVETPSNTDRGSFQESTISSASTNTDICVLDSTYTNEDIQFLPEHDDELEQEIIEEFVESEDGDDVFLRDVDVLDKNEDFTVLQKVTKTRCPCNCEESTEVLMLMNSEYQEKRKPTYSGTDSDVEVLTSEEIIDSDWSSGNGIEDHVKESSSLNDTIKLVPLNINSEDKFTSDACLQQSVNSNSVKTQASTEFDVFSKEFIDAPTDKYQHLNRTQLLEVIHKKEICIQDIQFLPEHDQYQTPLGSKDTSPTGNESESIEVVETPSNTYRGPFQETTISSASTNNTDICVLDSTYTNKDIQFLPEHDQYETTLGSKDTSPTGNESESIEVVETPSNTDRGPFQESTISSASNNKTDVCVLDSTYTNEDIQFLPEHDDEFEQEIIDEFVESEDGDDVFLRAVDVLDKNEDFTVLQKPIKTSLLCNCEESTEVLMLMNSEYQEKRKPTFSGTDSGVEVLTSQEIIDSDSSSGNGLEDRVKESSLLNDTIKLVQLNINSEDKFTSDACLQQSVNSNSVKTQASTDFDVFSKEFIDAPTDKYQHLNRSQLLEVIHKQEICIQALEATVERYQKAQDRLFEHVDALRLELNELRITPLPKVNPSEKN